MTLQDLMAALYGNPESLKFDEVLATIDSEFEFTPCAFTNGDLSNSVQENQGSCKVLSFAHKAGLAEGVALKLFAEHYRDVLENPEGNNHQNIRQFMKRGWMGVSFNGSPLKKK